MSVNTAMKAIRDAHRREHPDCPYGDEPHYVPPGGGTSGFYLCDPPEDITNHTRCQPPYDHQHADHMLSVVHDGQRPPGPALGGNQNMSQQIIKQPDGRLAVWSTIVDDFVLLDAEPDELIDWFASCAAEAERGRIAPIVEDVLFGRAVNRYHQFTMTWDEALAEARDRHGADPNVEATEAHRKWWKNKPAR